MRRNRCGFSIVELLIVLAVVTFLIGLLLPALQAAREASRRAVCQNNLRQIALSILNYEEVINALPVGARSQHSQPSQGSTHGVSWWVEVLPHLEQGASLSKFDKKAAHSGFALLNTDNGRAVDAVVISTMLCPSSPLPPLWPVGGFQLMMPAYVGIAGATSQDEFTESRISACCGSQPSGEIAAGGVLISNQSIRQVDVEDGTSTTMMIGEISDYAITMGGTFHRIDGAFPNGWIIGTSARGTPSDYIGKPPVPSWNITTLRYTVNTKTYGLPGISNNYGPNNPLVAAHPGGVDSSMTDGSVRFVANDMDLVSLKRIATRDDGQF